MEGYVVSRHNSAYTVPISGWFRTGGLDIASGGWDRSVGQGPVTTEVTNCSPSFDAGVGNDDGPVTYGDDGLELNDPEEPNIGSGESPSAVAVQDVKARYRLDRNLTLHFLLSTSGICRIPKRKKKEYYFQFPF